MLPNKKVLAAILLGAAAFVLFGAGKSGVTSEDAHQLVKQGALLLDVRTAGEFSSGHLEGAVNIPVQELEARVSSLPVKKDAPIVVYCRRMKATAPSVARWPRRCSKKQGIPRSRTWAR